MVELIGNVDTKFWQNKKIVVTGGRGFVGSHVVDNLKTKRGVSPENILIPTSDSYDLRKYEDAQRAVESADIVLHLAAHVGGIGYSSTHPATQMRNCLLLDTNMFEAAAEKKVEKFICVSSAVAYPQIAESPLKEEDLFRGPPAKGGYGYGFAKRMAAVMTQAYREEKGLNAVVLLSANSYGPRQDISLESGHVVPSLIRKCYEFDKLEVWGDGSQVRDFFYVKDFAEAVLLAAEKLETSDPVNIGSGVPVSIKELVETIVELTGFKGEVFFDSSKPQGQKIRVLDISKAKNLLGFSPSFTLRDGIKNTIDWYKSYAKNNSGS